METLQSFYSKVIHILILVLLIPSPGPHAQIVADKNSGKGPDIDNAQNGVPIVNINEASKHGISMNKFEDYNVGKEGVIINNSNKDGVTELGGAILANGNLNGREADMVAFDVTGKKRSQIRGATEMFGKNAGFILSNTNGIYVNGGEFINIPNVTLTTGEINHNEDLGNIIYDVERGEIHIDGAGINASNTDYVDMISRTMKVTNADIWAGKELNIVLGQNEVDSETGEIKAKSNGTPKPKSSLDASAFGAMVAGRIKIISTEAGVGVISEGDFISTEGDVYINSAGDIKYGGISAQKNIDLISEGNISQSKYAQAGEDITLTAKQTAEINGAYIDANGNIKLIAETAQIGAEEAQATEIKIETGKVQLNGATITAATLNIDASEEIDSDANIHTETLTLGSEAITNKGNITTNALTLSATNFTNEEAANLTAIEKLSIWAYKKATNAGKIQSNATLDLNAETLENAGTIIANRTLSINSDSLENDGKVITTIATITTDIFENTKEFFANLLNLNTGDLNNDGHIESHTQKIDAKTIKNTGAIIAATQTLNSENLTNIGLIYSEALEIQAEKNITNAGEMIGINSLNASGMTIENNGRMATLKTLWITAKEKFKNTGKLDAKTTQIETPDITNSGQLLASDISISAENIHNEGEITANNTLEIKTKKLVNSSGKLISNDTSIKANTLENHGLIAAIKTLLITATESFQNTKDIDAQALTIKSQVQDNSGRIKSTELAVEATDIQNAGEILANNASITTNALTNTGILYTNDTLKLNARNQLKNEESLIADTAHINVDKMNNQGLIWSNTLSVTSNTLENTGALESTTQNIHAKQLVNSGVIYGTIIALNATNVTNSGTVYSEKQTTLQVENTLHNEGFLIAKDTLEIGANQLNNTGSLIASTAQIDTDFLNTEGELQTNELDVAATTINISGTLETNIGLTLNARDISIRTNSLTNIKHILAKTLSINTDTLENTGSVESETQHITAKNLTNSGLLHSKTQNLISEHLTNTGIIYGLLQTIRTNTLINEATIFAEDTQAITAENDIKNTGDLIGKNNLSLDADNLQNNGLITSLQATLINIKNALTNTGTIESTALTITSEQLTNEGDLVAEQTKIKTKTLNNAQEIYADNLTITADTHIENTGNLIGKNTLTLNAESTSNEGLIASLKTTLINIKNTLINAGTIESETISLESPNFTNDGILIAKEATLKSNQFINNQDIAADTLTISSNALTNTRSIESRALNIQAENLKNIGMINSQVLALTSDQLTNSGIIYGFLQTISANTLLNENVIFAEDTLEISSESEIKNTGELIGKNKITLKAHDLQNNGLITSLKTTLIDIKNTLANSGTIESEIINLESPNFTNEGTLIANEANLKTEHLTNNQDLLTNTLKLETKTLLNANNIESTTQNIETQSLTNTGTIFAEDALVINAEDRIENTGSLIGINNLTLNADTLQNHSLIASLKTTLLTIKNKLINTGSIESETMTLTSNEFENDGYLVSKQINIQTDALTNTKEMTSEELNITSNTLINSGRAQTSKTLYIDAKNIENSGELISQDAINLNAKNLTNINLIAAQKSLEINLENKLTNEGRIESQSQTIQINRLDNAGILYGLTQALQSTTIHNSGLIFAQDQVINTNGLTNTGTIKAENELLITATNSITNTGALVGTNKLNIIAHTLQNNGLLATLKTLVLNPSRFLSNTKTISAKEIQLSTTSFFNTGEVNSETLEGNVSNLTNRGDINTSGKATIFSNDISNKGKIIANEAHITANTLTNTGTLYTKANLDINARTKLINNGNLISESDLNIDTKELKNNNVISSLKNLIVTVSKKLTNSGKIDAQDTAFLTADSLENQEDALIAALNELSIKTTKAQTNKGFIQSQDKLTLESETLINDFLIASDGTLIIRAKDLNNTTFITGKHTTFDLETLKNSGYINSQNDITLDLKILENTEGAQISSDKTLKITLENEFENQGDILSDNLSIEGTTITNKGNLTASNALNIKTEAALNNETTIFANNIAITANALSQSQDAELKAVENITVSELPYFINKGHINAGKTIKMSTREDFNNDATIVAGEDLHITSGGNLTNTHFLGAAKNIYLIAKAKIKNLSGEIWAGEDVNLSTEGPIENTADSMILAGKNINANSEREFTNQGRLIATGDIKLTTQKSLDNKEGIIKARKNLEITVAKDLDNSGGYIAADGDLHLQGDGTLSNTDGTIKKGEIPGYLYLTDFYDIDNQNGSIYSARKFSIEDATRLQNQSGKITSSFKMEIEAGTIENQNGKINSGGILEVEADLLENQSGYIRANRWMTLDIDTINNNSTQEKNNDGKYIKGIHAAKSLTMTTNKFNNKDGFIYTGEEAILENINNENGIIEANGKLKIRNAENIFQNQNGNITNFATGGSTELFAGNGLNNQGGQIFSNGDIDLEVDDDYEIIGTLESASNITIKARNLVNRGRALAGNILRFVATAVFTNEEGATTFAGNSLIVEANTLINKGELLSNGDITLEVDTLLHNQENALIKSTGTTTITGESLIVSNNAKIATLAGDLKIQADKLLNNTSITSGGDLNITTNTLIENTGEDALLFSRSDMSLYSNQNITNTEARIFSLGNMSLVTNKDTGDNEIRNYLGVIESQGDMSITTSRLINERDMSKERIAFENPDLTPIYDPYFVQKVPMLEALEEHDNLEGLKIEDPGPYNSFRGVMWDIESDITEGNIRTIKLKFDKRMDYVVTTGGYHSRGINQSDRVITLNKDTGEFLLDGKRVNPSDFEMSDMSKLKKASELEELGYRRYGYGLHGKALGYGRDGILEHVGFVGNYASFKNVVADFEPWRYRMDNENLWKDIVDEETFEHIVAFNQEISSRPESEKAKILAGNNLNINADYIENKASAISAKNELDINTIELKNIDINLNRDVHVNYLNGVQIARQKNNSEGRIFFYGWNWKDTERTESYGKVGALISGSEVKINGNIENGSEPHNFTPSEEIPDAEDNPINAPQINLPTGENGLFITDLEDEEGPLIKTNLDDYVDPDGYVGLADYLDQLKDAETPDQESINIDSETLDQYEDILGEGIDENIEEIGKIEGEINERATFTTPVINSEEIATDKKTKEKSPITDPTIKLEEDRIAYSPSEVENESNDGRTSILEFNPEYIAFAGGNQKKDIDLNDPSLSGGIPKKTDLQEIVLNNQYRALPDAAPDLEVVDRRNENLEELEKDDDARKVSYLKAERDKNVVSGPISRYTKETDKKYTNVKTLQGSDYYTERIGFNSDEDTRLLGDQFFEQQFIRDQLIEQTGRQYLVSGNTTISDKSLMNMLYGNALIEQHSQDLKVGMALSGDQIAALSTDIIWPVEQIINGRKVLVPTLYLSQVTKDNIGTLEGSAIVGEYVTIEGGNLENRGTISSGRSLSIDVDSLENEGGAVGGNIFSGGMALITSNGTITNKGGSIHANDLLWVNSIAGDIINTVITTNTQIGSGTGTKILAKGNISSGKMLDLAAINIKNIGSTLNAGETAFISTKGDILNQAVKTTLSFGSKETSEGHDGATLKTGKSLIVESGGDLKVEGSKFDIGEDFFANVSGNIGFSSVVNNYNYKDSTQTLRSATHQKSDIKVGGSWQTQTGGDTTLHGADVEIGKSAIVNAGGDFNIFSVDNTSYEKRVQKKKGSFGSSKTRTFITEKSHNIASTFKVGQKGDATEVEGGGLRNNMLVVNTGGDMTLLGSDVESDGHTVLGIGGSLNLLAGEDAHTFKYSSKKKGIGSAAQNQSVKMDIIKRGSTLKTGGDLVGTIENKMVLEGAKVNVGGGLDLEAKEGVDLLSAEDLHYYKSKKSRSTLGGILGSSSHEIEKIKTRSKGTLVDTVGSAKLKTDGDIDLVGSTIRSGGDTTLDAGESINIVSAVEMDYKFEKKEKLSFSGASLEGELKQEGKRDSHENTKYTQKASEVYSGGNFITRSGKDTTVAGSNIISDKKIDMKSDGNINIISTEEMEDTIDKSASLTNTIRARVGNAYVETAEAAADAVEAAGDDSKLGKVRAALATAKLAKSTARAAASSGTYGFYVSVEQELEVDEKETQETNHTAKTSLLVGKEGLSLDAEKEINIEGAALASQGEVVLDGKEGVTIEAAENRQKTNYSHNNYKEKKELFNTTGIMNDIEISKSSETQSNERKWYTNASVEGDKVTIKSENDVLVSGATVTGREVDMSEVAGDITVESKQDTETGSRKEERATVGGRYSYGKGYGSQEKAWVTNQTQIIGTEKVTVGGKTLTVEGAMIATIDEDGNDAGGVEINSEKVIVKDIKDRDYAYDESYDIRYSGSKKTDDGSSGQGSVGASFSNMGHEREQINRGTIGGGTINSEEIEGNVNRDITKAQEITKDKKLGGINESIDIDMAYIKDFKGTVKEDAKNIKGMVYTKEAGWGGNTKRAGQRFKKGAEDLIDAGKAAIQKRVNPITDMKNSTDFRNATTDFQRENPELAAVLNNEEKKGSAEYQEALGEYNNYVQVKMGNAPIETGLYDSNQMSDSEKVDENGNRKDGYGIADMDTRGIYINTAVTDMSDTNELIGVAGHENIHAGGERSEVVADRGMAQAQNAWESENKFNGNTTGGGYAGGQDWYSSNHDTETIKNGTSGASGVTDAQPMSAGPLPVIPYEFKQKFEEANQPLVNVKRDHYNRNQNNKPELATIEMSPGESIFHTQGPDGKNNKKYVSPDGHHEAIYDGSGNLVTDPLNMPTYNKANPADNWAHGRKDIVPYILWGNSPNDPSEFDDRFKLSIEGMKQRIINER